MGGHGQHSLSSRELEESIRAQHLNDPKLGNFLLYSKPNQRQQWGDHQAHPVVNYGDLFFDLFYVAAAYNLSYIIRNDPTSEGFLYFIACFLGVYQFWWDKTFYDARFFTYDDAYHRLFTVAVLAVLATAVVNIRAVKILSNPTDNVEPFALCISLLLGTVLSCMRYAEMLVAGCAGQPVALVVARRDALQKVATIILYLAATVVTGMAYFGNNDSDSHAKDDDHRILAGDDGGYGDEKSETTDVPIYLILGGTIAYLVAGMSQMVTLPEDFKTVTVPINVDFTIHRYGEWIMLMLGEAVLSLLIVGTVPVGEFYITFFCGILSVILLQYMHFRSQPGSADGHAMRRSRGAGFLFAIMMQIYSAALVILGVSYKMLLYEFRNLGYARRMLLPGLPRWLAGGDEDSGFNTEDRRQRIAHFFCISMAVVFFTSDVVMLAHRGLEKNWGRCHCMCKVLKAKKMTILLLRAGCFVFIATLSQYETDPTLLAVSGLCSIFLQIVLRVLSSIYFLNTEQVHIDLKENQERQEPEEEAEEEAEKMAEH